MKFRYENIGNSCGEIVDDLLGLPGLPSDEMSQFNLRLALEEAVQNKVNYAYPDGNGWLEAEADIVGGVAVFVLADGGEPFDPLSLPDPRFDLPVSEMKVGGLGVYLYRKLMDEVSYRREEGKNVLTLKKRII